MTSNLILFLLVISFEDHFGFFILFLSKYLKRNRNEFFDLNTVKKEEAVKSHSEVSKSDSATLSLVIVPWLLLQSFNRFFLFNLIYIHLFFFNISLKFLLATILKVFA